MKTAQIKYLETAWGLPYGAKYFTTHEEIR